MEQWWKKAVFYEVYMPSFADGNKDGVGDFKGLTEKLDYFTDLGIDCLWLTPFYKSPKVDNGYDISNYYEIDPDYGTIVDFEHFIEQAHNRKIRVIADLVLNHTSSEHEWFKDAISDENHPKRDWYIWRDSIDGKPPNNWESFFGGSAWEFDEKSGQYYYHAFAKEQVDLNWANPEVKHAMFKMMAFWLNKGIDGFRLDVINFLKVNNTFENNPIDENNHQIHKYDKDQAGILDVIEEISSFVHQFSEKVLVGEVGSEEIDLLATYSGKNKLDVVFNFNLGSIPTFHVDTIFAQLQKMEAVHKEDQLPTLFFSSHDMPRLISRFGEDGIEVERAKLLATLILTAKGVPFLYYGDEIGMRDIVHHDISLMKDIQGVTAYELSIQAGKTIEEALVIANEKSRDKSRSPMQWDNSEYNGFSTAKPWMSFPEKCEGINVKQQLVQNASILSYYKRLIELRRDHPALHQGEYQLLEKKGEMIYFIKVSEDEQVMVLLNFGKVDVPFPEEAHLAIEILQSSKRENVDTTVQPGEAIIMYLKGDKL
ncbi:glycoside hydrolase family 13 protein [Metabacillus bambusae]|uniref:Alpha-glucosidase n=1 Tax=Metabacillus bambusae TaxID=2795218 RepID=A0ABS3N172_9BACI|nr:alpha-glucosidase [Metabacillus bambusae]MBO1511826.1 alpha-glucosidase [Metabacillus bambusae]